MKEKKKVRFKNCGKEIEYNIKDYDGSDVVYSDEEE